MIVRTYVCPKCSAGTEARDIRPDCGYCGEPMKLPSENRAQAPIRIVRTR